MNYANIKSRDIANGPGVRVSLFVSGCEHYCKGCFNKEAWDFDYGDLFTQDTINKLIDLLKPDFIDGLTLLGGEPFHPRNQPALIELLRQIKEQLPNKSIWAFSGYLYDDIISGNVSSKELGLEFLKHLDVLVDGPFIENKKNLSLRFRGSENQRLIDVKKSLSCGDIVIWKDWQDDKKGLI